MPSIVHEAPMELIRQHPPLVLDLLRAVSGLELGGDVRVDLVSADASHMIAQYLADGVALVKDEYDKPVLAIIIEVQGRDADTKKYSWPVYLCSIRSKLNCDAILLVICWNPGEVAGCRQTIRTGHPGFDLSPIVAHPGNALDGDGEGGEPGPYLVLFAGYIGAIDLDTDDGQRMILEAARQVPDTNRDTCVTLILAVASEAARRAMEAKMATPAYRSDFIESFKAEGRAEGKTEGRAEGRAEELVSAIMKTLAARGIQVDKKRTEQVQSCTDLDQLNAWFDAALTAKTADDVFGS
jgi:hypothetical protein